MSLLFEAILTGYRPRKDKSIVLSLTTQEVTSDDVKEIHEHQEKFGILYFKEGTHISEKEQEMIDNFKMTSAKGKTHSQRLRGVLYLIYNRSDEKENKSFDEFYAERMEKIIQFYKDKLDEAD